MRPRGTTSRSSGVGRGPIAPVRRPRARGRAWVHHAKLAYPRGVDQGTPAGEHDQFAPGGRMSALPVSADPIGGFRPTAQRSDQDRLADARRPHHPDGHANAEVGLHVGHPLPRLRAEGDTGSPGRDVSRGTEVADWIVRQFNLFGYHDAVGATVLDGREVAFPSPRIEVTIGGGDHEADGQVCRGDLIPVVGAGRATREGTFTFEQMVNRRTVRIIRHHDPVARRGRAGHRQCPPEAARHGPEGGATSSQLPHVHAGTHGSRGAEVGRRVELLEPGREELRESQIIQGGHTDPPVRERTSAEQTQVH